MKIIKLDEEFLKEAPEQTGYDGDTAIKKEPSTAIVIDDRKSAKDYQTKPDKSTSDTDYNKNGYLDIKDPDDAGISLNKCILYYIKSKDDGNLEKAGRYAEKALSLSLKNSAYTGAEENIPNLIKNILSPGSNVGIMQFIDALGPDNLKNDKNPFMILLKNYTNQFIKYVKDKQTFQNIYDAYYEGKLDDLLNSISGDNTEHKDIDVDQLIGDLANNKSDLKKEDNLTANDLAQELLKKYGKDDLSKIITACSELLKGKK